MNLEDQIQRVRDTVTIEQLNDELAPLLQLALDHEVKSVLEIGSRFGGTLKCWLHILNVKYAMCIDLPLENDAKVTQERDALWRSWLRYNQTLNTIFGRSESKSTLDRVYYQLTKPIDMVFIDGGHSYEQVKADYKNYAHLAKKIVAIHDITPSTVLSESEYGVPKFWNEVRPTHGLKIELKGKTGPNGGYGIGVIVL